MLVELLTSSYTFVWFVFGNEGLLPQQCVCVFLCRALKEHNPGAVILSTDEYFTRAGFFQFDPSALGEAHAWNQKRGKDGVLTGVYAALAIER